MSCSTEGSRVDAAPDVSVLLPVHNALPWLCDAVGSILAQRGVTVELLAVDDRSSDGSLQWLQACERALQEHSAPGCGWNAYDTCVEDALAGRLPWQAAECQAATPEAVARRATPGNSLRVLTVTPAGVSGQGLALNEALAVARGRHVAEMEADDLRPPDTFATLLASLEQHPEWDGVTSRVALAGWPECRGMQRWVAWQNGVGIGDPDDMARSRFIEIPAMRAAGLYRRPALARLGARPYRDLWETPDGGGIVDLARGSRAAAPAAGDGGHPLPGWWPVDSDFFGRWFAAGLRLAKMPAALYVWRQYPQQSTRTHSRCALERLRACNAFYLTQGPLAACPPVQLWGTGDTLAAWAAELAGRGVSAQAITWRPGQAVGKGAPGEACPAGGIRLWCFGMPKARLKVRLTAPGGFLEGTRDWFVG